MGKHFNAEIYRKLQQTHGSGDEQLSEAERAASWDDFESFRDDKCLREVDVMFNRMFGAAQ